MRLIKVVRGEGLELDWFLCRFYASIQVLIVCLLKCARYKLYVEYRFVST
jgi:hypothetical protein